METPPAPAAAPIPTAFERWRDGLRRLYFGKEPASRAFRWGLLAFDIAVIVYFLVSATIDARATPRGLDYALALAILADMVARIVITPRPWANILGVWTIVDMLVIVSLVVPIFVDHAGFLRVIRMLRLLRSYHVVRELREHSAWFKRNEEVIQSSLNLAVFVFFISAVVYVLEGHKNEKIGNYFDALYFTVTTLTTTGFGDITMSDTTGRMLAVVIMLVGVGLFIRLVQVIFRPNKVRFPCPACGLTRHEPDAVHCKSCGTVLAIPDEGRD